MLPDVEESGVIHVHNLCAVWDSENVGQVLRDIRALLMFTHSEKYAEDLYLLHAILEMRK